jgi:hypothetical protein
MLNKENHIHNFVTVSVRTFVIPFYYGSGTVNGIVINYGSGSPKAKSYGSVFGSGRLVTVLQIWNTRYLNKLEPPTSLKT